MLKIQYLDSKRIKWLKSTLWKISTQRDSLKRPFPLGAHFSAIFPALCYWSYIKGLFWPRHHDIAHGGSISAFKQVPKPTLISALKKKLRREYNLRSVNLRCSKACKPNSNSNALSILSLDDVALDYDGAIKTYTGSGTDLVIGMEGAALYASSPNALEVLLGEALAKTWANRYNKNTDIVL